MIFSIEPFRNPIQSPSISLCVTELPKSECLNLNLGWRPAPNLVFLLFYQAPVLRSQPSTRSLMARSGQGQLRRTSSSFRCSYTLRFPGERVTYNRQVPSGAEGLFVVCLFVYLLEQVSSGRDLADVNLPTATSTARSSCPTLFD